MSNERLSAVWKYSTAEKGSLLVMLSLADRADNDGFCWPSLADISRRTKITYEYCLTLIDKQEKEGELFIHKRPGKVHQYIVTPGQTLAELITALEKRFSLDEDLSLEWIQNRPLGKILGVELFSIPKDSEGSPAILPSTPPRSYSDEPLNNPKETKNIDNLIHALLSSSGGKENKLTKSLREHSNIFMNNGILKIQAQDQGVVDLLVGCKRIIKNQLPGIWIEDIPELSIELMED